MIGTAGTTRHVGTSFPPSMIGTTGTTAAVASRGPGK
jgi:hypothetical protein